MCTRGYLQQRGQEVLAVVVVVALCPLPGPPLLGPLL